MIIIKSFVFNTFATNTFVLYDETNECVIIDPGCSNEAEVHDISNYIGQKGLQVKAIIITHYHIDHILGIKSLKDLYNIPVMAHADGKLFWEHMESRGYEYGIKVKDIVLPDQHISEVDKIEFGNSELEIVETPGHAAGSICLINHPQKFVIAGDVLFYGSIGRTDLPSGDFDVLKNSILKKLFILDDSYTVYPGHGQKTVIGMERLHNPFLS